MNCSRTVKIPRTFWAKGGLLKELTKAVIERCLETELDSHLGYPKPGRKGNASGNTRNGQSQKTLKGEQGHVDIFTIGNQLSIGWRWNLRSAFPDEQRPEGL
jgi:transposase-like protein